MPDEQQQPQQTGEQYQFVKLPDGKYGKFAANATREQMRSQVLAKYPDAFGKPAATPDAPSFGNTLGREGKSLGQTIMGIPGGLYHAFTDPVSDEERQEMTKYEGEGGHIADSTLGLGVERLAIRPVERAAEWYYDAAKGNNPNAYDDALSVAPEGVGAGGAVPVGAKLAEMAPAAARAGVPPLVRGAAKVANKFIEKSPQAIGATVGGMAGHATGLPYGGIAGAGLGASIGREFPAPSFRVPGENFGIKPPVYPGAHLPANPFPTVEGEYLPPTPRAQLKAGPPEITPESASDIPWESQGRSLQVGPRINPRMQLPERSGGWRLPSEFASDIEAPARIIGNNFEPPPVGPRPTYADLMEDQGIQDTMRNDLERHGQRALREERGQMEEGMSADKPKWLREAEFRASRAAEQIMLEAEQKAARPARYTKNVLPGAKRSEYAPVGTSEEDLVPALQESIRRAKRR